MKSAIQNKVNQFSPPSIFQQVPRIQAPVRREKVILEIRNDEITEKYSTGIEEGSGKESVKLQAWCSI